MGTLCRVPVSVTGTCWLEVGGLLANLQDRWVMLLFALVYASFRGRTFRSSNQTNYVISVQSGARIRRDLDRLEEERRLLGRVEPGKDFQGTTFGLKGTPEKDRTSQAVYCSEA